MHLEEAPPAGVSGANPAMRRLRRGGAAGVRALDRNLLARGVRRILDVFFFVIFARKRTRLHEGGVLLRIGEGSDIDSSAARSATVT